ncbi:MAG: flagellar type III secretion system pore protein FliP [Planctomycetaceae bacterium]
MRIRLSKTNGDGKRSGENSSRRPLALRFATSMTALFLLCTTLFSSDAAIAQTESEGRSRPNQPVVRPVVAERDDQSLAPQKLPLELPQIPEMLSADQMTSPGGLTATLKILLLMTVISLAPSILIMTTCFIRFIIVLGLLRQALGTQQLPPNQVLVSLCLFLTFMVMAPVWKTSYDDGIRPYTSPQAGEEAVSFETAYEKTAAPLRRFMSVQIEQTGNTDTVWFLYEYQRSQMGETITEDDALPETYDDVPITVLLSAFMLSELKTSFIIGFQLYLPFIIIDMVIASVLISMGMMMLPPVLISLPFKLLLFVMIDGWFLTVGMLLESVTLTG